MALQDIYHPITSELHQIEALLTQSLQDSRNLSVEKIAEIVLDSPGKRIRPALTVLCGKAVSQLQPVIDPAADEKLIKIAAAFELIHMASLVHDDVIDESETRHNKPTINSVWGQDASVAFGDFLYAVSLQLTTDCRDLKLHRCMSQAARDMCEGELLQVCERNNFELTRENYLTIIEKKTAGLFAAACEAGGIVYGAPKENQDSLRKLGQSLGIAFQMIDDYLDIVAEEKNLGKTPGQDVEIGKLTLPLLYLLEELDADDRAAITVLLREADNPIAFQKIKEKLVASEAISKTIRDIHHYMTTAQSHLSSLPESIFKQSLTNLLDFIIERALSYSGSQS